MVECNLPFFTFFLKLLKIFHLEYKNWYHLIPLILLFSFIFPINHRYNILEKWLTKWTQKNGIFIVIGKCPEENRTIVGMEEPVGGIKDVKTWQTCSEHCRKLASCLFWSFHSIDNTCHLKTSYEGRREEVGFMSGRRSCGKKCTDSLYSFFISFIHLQY